VLSRFDSQFGDRDLASLTPDEILRFLNQITEGKKQTTKRTRYSCLKAFFILIRHTLDPAIQNACNAPMVRKLFKWTRNPLPDVLEKEVVDEIIFRTPNP
jgi:integrase/recombinase XerD